MDVKTLSKQALPYILALAVFGCLISCIPASVFSGDDGETVTASYTLGIQHPPGYPLMSLLGKIYTLVPAGDASYRVCMLSAALAAVNFLLIFMFFRRLLPVLGVAVLSGPLLYIPSFIYAAGFTIFQQSIIAKGGIYTLNNTFTILISMAILEMYLGAKKEKWLYLASLLFGLSLGNHLNIQAITLPAYLYFIYKAGGFKLLKPVKLALAGTFFASAAFIYAYLPIRAGTAVLNWGDPSTLENFFSVIIRWQYIYGEVARSVESSVNQLVQFLTSAGYESLWAGLLFSVLGAYFVFRRSKTLFFYLAAIPAICMLAVTLYLNLEKDKVYILVTYITPMYFPLAVFCGLGMHFVSGKISALFPSAGRVPVIAMFLALLCAQLAVFYPQLDKSRYYFTYDFNRNILNSLEPNSVIFVTGDGVVFPCWYLKYVKKYRTDITLIGSAVLPMQWVRDDAVRQNPALRMPVLKTAKAGTESTGYIINAILAYNMSRYNFYFSYNEPEKNAITGNIKLMPKGIVFRVMPSQYVFVSDKFMISNESLWQFYTLRGLFDELKKYGDERSRDTYISDYATSANSTGQFFEDNLFYGKSLDYYTLASRIDAHDVAYVYNMGNAYFEMKDYGMAIERYKKSIEIKPGYENAWFNLGVAYYTVKDYKDALEAFEGVIRVNPARRDVEANVALMKNLIGGENK
jgi:tetratricopeptide (TPR) repeat protein